MRNTEVIKELNKLLANELVAITQYFIHAKILANWGLNKLSAKLKTESIDEMKHADILIDRILFLEGTPALDNKKPNIGRDLQSILENDLQLELTAISELKHAISVADTAQDYGTVNLLQEILDNEEEHVNQLKINLRLLANMGETNYIQSQV